MDKNLIGDKTIPKTKKEKGIEKTINFSKIVNHDTFEKISLFNEKTLVSFETILASAFAFEGAELFTYEKESYTINKYQHDEKFILISVSKAKAFNDVLAKVKDSENNKIDTSELMLEYYTFLLFDIDKKIVAYISNKNVSKINTLLSTFIFSKSKEPLYIIPFAREDLKYILKNAYKRSKLTFTLNDTAHAETSASLDTSLGWKKELCSYKISVELKNVSPAYIDNILDDENKLYKIKNPKIEIINSSLKKELIDLFTCEFSIKSNIFLTDVDLDNNEKIKLKLIEAISNMG